MKQIITIFRKEMLDTLRDRRTLITMLVMPLVLIPLLINVAASVAVSKSESAKEKDLRIAIAISEEGADLIRQIENRKDARIYKDIEPYEYKDLIRSDSIDLGIVVEEGFDAAIAAGKTGQILVYYNSTDQIPYGRLQTTLDSYYESQLKSRLDSLSANKATITPTAIEKIDAYTQQESIGKTIGGFLPYIFVLFCLVGAMYPSIDLFTGEKERGTLETILTVPASRFQILLGKMMTVVISGVLSGGLAILGLYLTFQINPDIPSAFRNVLAEILQPQSIALIILMLIPLTIFFSGILIPASIYSRSFKEAQSLIQPMLIVVIIPLAVIASIPGLSLNFGLALIPVVNVGLASIDIIAGTINYSLLAVVFVSLIVFAGIGLMVCVRWFGQEGNIMR